MCKTIVSLSSEASKEVINYINKNSDINIINKVTVKGTILVDIYREELEKIQNVNIKESIEQVLLSPVCPVCGKIVDTSLLIDYRNNGECISKEACCDDCKYLSNKDYYNLKEAQGVEKNNVLSTIYKNYNI